MYIATEGECFRPADASYSWTDFDGDFPPCDLVPFDSIGDSAHFDIAAKLEPDADHDGFGDETQDQCPTNATTQGPCPAPATGQRAAAIKKCKKKHKGKAQKKKRKKCIKKAKKLPV